MDELLAGPDGVRVRVGDPVAPAKALVDFAKDHKAARGQGRLHRARASSVPTGVKALASLPSREELIAKLMGTHAQPGPRFMRCAQRPGRARSLASLQAVADQKAAA